MYQIKRFLSALLTAWLVTIPVTTHAKNCTKGKPCGNGCIAKNKTCRIDNPLSPQSGNSQPHSVIRRSLLRLPKVYQVLATVYARQAPHSPVTTGYYKQGQSVFVYGIEDGWAQISNMQPEEWLNLKVLRPK
jgi:hypothetical protein